jgi:hypothetical protein
MTHGREPRETRFLWCSYDRGRNGAPVQLRKNHREVKMNAKWSWTNMMIPLSLLTLVMALSACDSDITGPNMGPGPIDIDVDPQDYHASAAFSYEVPLQGQTSVRLRGVNGKIRFVGSGSSTALKVSGVREVGAATQTEAQAGLALLGVHLMEGDEDILIQSDHPRKDGRNYKVDYVVELPRNLKVTVESTNGEVRVEGMADDVTVDLTNGLIAADVSLPQGGALDLFTVNGDIDLAIQREASAHFRATLTHGKITTQDLTLFDKVETAKSLTGRLGEGAGQIKLGLVNGDIRAAGK